MLLKWMKIIQKRKNIIEKTLTELGLKSNLHSLMLDAEKNEQNSNQILDFTKEVKKPNNNFKVTCRVIMENYLLR